MTEYLLSDVDNYPIEHNLDQISDHALSLHKSECKVVFVVTKYTVEILITIIFEVYWVGQYLDRTLENGEPEVVGVNVRKRGTKPWLDHVCDDD